MAVGEWREAIAVERELLPLRRSTPRRASFGRRLLRKLRACVATKQLANGVIAILCGCAVGAAT